MTGEVEKRFSSGAVKATVWKNVSKDGNAFRTVSLSRGYKKDGEWKNTNSLGENDISKAIEVLEQARDFLSNGASEEVAA